MTYALAGTGNMAWLIASRMLAAGHTCIGAWGRNAADTAALCATYSLPHLATQNDLHDGPDAMIIAVSDSGIPEVVKPFSFRSTTLIHTAGSVPMSVLSAHSARTGVVWPVYSIRKASLPAHRAFPAVVEANTPEAGAVVRAVAKAICDTTYETGSEQRLWLHLAAVISNNFVNHLLGMATDICTAQSVPVSVLTPIVEQTVAAMRTQHPSLTQTGPARRHDADTIEKQLSMLDILPHWQALYTAITEAIMARFPLTAEK